MERSLSEKKPRLGIAEAGQCVASNSILRKTTDINLPMIFLPLSALKLTDNATATPYVLEILEHDVTVIFIQRN